MAMEKAKGSIQLKKDIPLIFLALPGVIYLIINNYIPMFGLFIAFKDVNYAKGLFGSDWCGFNNFKFLFKTNDAVIMIRNTLLYNIAFIVIGTVLAVFVAILFSEMGANIFAKIYQAGMVFPNLVSMVIVAYIGYAFLNSTSGFINMTILKAMNIEGISWYSKPEYWPVILLIVHIWKGVGYSSIIYISNIAGIDKGIYEAAKIDGAGKFRQIVNITLPMLRPTIIIMALMAVGKIFNSDFGLFYQVPMNSGTLYPTTQTIDTYVYRALMENNDVGMSAAAGFLQSIVGFILVLTANLTVRRLDPDNALF